MRETETKMIQEINALLGSYSENWSALGLTFDSPELEVWQNGEDNYTSEIRIFIRQDGNIDDVLEFHVYDKGQLVMTTGEAIEWIRGELDALEKNYHR